MELFAHKGLLTKIISQSAEVLESRDLWGVKRGTYTTEYDLTRKQAQDRVLYCIKRGQVRWLHCAPPRRDVAEAKVHTKITA